MIISFSTTSKLAKKLGKQDPLFEGIKTVTRRKWSEITYLRIMKNWDIGNRQHEVWSNVAFVPGAAQMGVIHLTCRPYLEKLEDMPEEDIYHEGNLWKTKNEFIQMLGIKPDTVLTVVRFNFIPIISIMPRITNGN
jgi:hypothetical protein